MVQVSGCSAGLSDLRSFNLHRVHSQCKGHQRTAGGRLGVPSHTRLHLPLMPSYRAGLPLANFGWGASGDTEASINSHAPSRRHNAYACLTVCMCLQLLPLPPPPALSSIILGYLTGSCISPADSRVYTHDRAKVWHGRMKPSCESPRLGSAL